MGTARSPTLGTGHDPAAEAPTASTCAGQPPCPHGHLRADLLDGLVMDAVNGRAAPRRGEYRYAARERPDPNGSTRGTGMGSPPYGRGPTPRRPWKFRPPGPRPRLCVTPGEACVAPVCEAALSGRPLCDSHKPQGL
ncbi:hypothetical protein GCM10010233_43380 [Streptomyces pseudogriseolus]|nr:hypothetical protein GCM10010233_43380 [Streptomyces gancidicus]